MPDRPPSCRFPARCDWSSAFNECSREACYDPQLAAGHAPVAPRSPYRDTETVKTISKEYL